MKSELETVLIADDNAGTRRVLERCLGEGRRLLTAEDGLTALDLARAHRPALIILDVRMPGLDGYDVCAQLRDDEDTRAIPILMLTGLDVQEAAYRSIGQPADAWMAKPFNVNELVSRVGELLAGRLS